MSKTFNVANCRGSKPVLIDIKNAYLTIAGACVELNHCSAKTHLIKAREELWAIIEGEGYEINHNNKLVKKERKQIMTDYKKGDRVKVVSDNDNYDNFRDKILIIINVATNTDEHPGYDDTCKGQGLYDFIAEDGSEVGCSLYDYELERA